MLVPFTSLHPVTARLVNRHAPAHVRVRIAAGEMDAYWRLLAHWWREPGDLVIVEQDIGIHAGVLEGFDSCRLPWCGHPYPIGHLRQMLVCLGCTRFTAELKAAEPDLLEAVGRVGGDGLPAKDWRRLDVRLGDELRWRGYEVHQHEPAVSHFHRY